MNEQSHNYLNNEKIIHDSAQMILRAFESLNSNVQAESRRFNEERQKVMENLERGSRITKHRINL